MLLGRLSVALLITAGCAPTDMEGFRAPGRVSARDDDSTSTREASTGSTTQKPLGVDAGTPDPTRSKGCSAKKPAGLLPDQSITIAGTARTYDLSVPEGYDPQRGYPLVFVFHGSGQTAAQVRTMFGFDSVAADKAFFVYPNGIGQQWDLNTDPPANPDITLFDTLIAFVADNYCLDSTHVFSTGFSNGSFFTNQLGCRRGDRLRAIVSHSGGGPFDDDSAYDAAGHLKCAGRPPAALIVHGDSDWIVGVDKGDESARHWTWANGCGANSNATAPAPCVGWTGCKAPVEYCRIPGIGHWLWSEGTKKTWSFFASF